MRWLTGSCSAGLIPGWLCPGCGCGVGACPGEKGTVAVPALRCHLAAVTAPGERPCAAASWCPGCSKDFSCPWRWKLVQSQPEVLPGWLHPAMVLWELEWDYFDTKLEKLCAHHLRNPCVVFVVREAGDTVNLSEENPVWGISPSPCELLSPHLCRCLRQL